MKLVWKENYEKGCGKKAYGIGKMSISFCEA
jgi:hypothetical protein